MEELGGDVFECFGGGGDVGVVWGGAFFFEAFACWGDSSFDVAAYGGGGFEAFGVVGGDGDGAVSALAESGDGEFVGVEVSVGCGLVEHHQDGLFVVFPLGHVGWFLWGDDDEGPAGWVFEDGGWESDGELFVAVGSGFAEAVEEEDGGVELVDTLGDHDGVVVALVVVGDGEVVCGEAVHGLVVIEV